MRQACMCVGECLRVHVRLGARAHTGQKLQSGKWRASRAQIKILTTLHRRNTTFEISTQVSEFKSDTIQARNGESALATEIFIFSIFCNSSKRSSASSAPLLTLTILSWERRCQTEKEIIKKEGVKSNRKGKTCSFCIWHPTKGYFTNVKKKTKKKQRRSGQAPGRTCTSLSHNDGKRSHGENTPNHLVNHVCKCVRFILFVSLTTVFASLSAPASNKSCTVAVWP